MPNQQIGVEAVFDIGNFTKGVNDYIQQLNNAETATTNFVNTVNAAARSMSDAFRDASVGVQSATDAVTLLGMTARSSMNLLQEQQRAQREQQQTAEQAGQSELARLKLISDEIRDQLSLERLIVNERGQSLTQLQQIQNQIERNQIAQRRDIRDFQASLLGDNSATLNQLAEIRRTAVNPADLTKGTEDVLSNELRFTQLISQELQARRRELQIARQLQQGILNAYQQEQAILERSTIQLERRNRLIQAAALQANRINELWAAGQRDFTDEELGIKQRDVLQDQVRLQQILSDEVRDQVRLRQAELTIADKTSTELQRQQAIIERAAIGLRRQQRDVQIATVGGNVQQLGQIRNANVELADLGKKQASSLQNQLTLQGLLSAELQDRVREEQASLILNDQRSSALQRQQALLTQQTIQLERQRRLQLAQELGGARAVADLQTVRNTAVAFRDLNREVQRTGKNLDQVTSAGIAVASTFGVLVAQGIISATRGMIDLSRSILETVTFFERIDLSVKFFTARSQTGVSSNLTYAETLRVAGRDAEALFFWLQKLAVASPFTTKDVATLFRTAQAYGLTRQEAELFTPLLLDFAAAAGLNEEILERLALALGQVRARGKLTGEEIRQLGNSGLPIRDILVKSLGIANKEFDDLVESGALTSNVVIPAIIKELKTFKGAGEDVAFNTIGGIVSAFKELAEIGTATFFREFLAPLKEGFQKFFVLVNRPEVLAFIKILGKELGTNFRRAILSVIESVRNLINAWINLDPVVQKQIVVFSAAFIAFVTLASAVALLVAAVNTLVNPLTIAAVAFAFFLSEWTSGFAVVNNAIKNFANKVTGALSDILQVATEVFSGMTSVINNELRRQSRIATDFINAWVRFGQSLGKIFNDGFLKGFQRSIGATIKTISSVLTYWFKPNSPPRVVPNIDDWGLKTGQLYWRSLASYAPTEEFTALQDQIAAMAAKNNKKLYGPPTAPQRVTDFIPGNEQAIARATPAITKAYMDLGRNSVFAFKVGVENANENVKNAGINASDEFVEGFYSRLPRLTARISDELNSILSRIGGGAQLSQRGAFAINQFLDGFKNGDFSILNDIVNVIDSFFSTLVDSGQIGEIDLPRILFGAQESVAKAISEFRNFGKISQETFRAVRQAAGGAGHFVADLLTQYQVYANAANAAKEAQEELNAVTKQYDNILKPLKKQLDDINNAVTFADEEERIASLRRLIKNEAVSDRRKATAQLQIQQILQQRQVREVENERDARVSLLEELVEARNKEKDAAQEQLEIIQSRIDLQLKQLDYVGQEASLIRQLNEEAAQLRKKQLSELDLQKELLRLQGEELADNIKAAKAKYDLDRADSTELEKQQAIIALQEVAISRRNRLLEAAEFGIPPEQFTRLRDVQILLSDIGVSAGKVDLNFSEELTGFEDGLVNINSTLAEIDEAAQRAGTAWSQFKSDFVRYMTEINNSLPDIFKFLPGEDGSEPPIIATLQAIGTALVTFVTLMTINKVAKTLFETAIGIRAIYLAIKAFPGSSAAEKFAGWLSVIGSNMEWFIGIAARFFPVIASVAILGGAYKLLWDAAFQDAQESYEENIKNFENQKAALQEALSFNDLQIPNELPQEVRTEIEKILADAATGSTAYLETVYQNIGSAIYDGVIQGIIDPEDQRTKDAINQFYSDLYNVFAKEGEIKSPSERFARDVGLPIGQGVVEGVKRSLEDTKTTGQLTAAIQAVLTAIRKEMAAMTNLTKDSESFAARIRAALIGQYALAREGVAQEVTLLKRLAISETTDMYNKITQRYILLRTRLAEIMFVLKTQSYADWTTVRFDAVTQIDNMSSSIQTSMATLQSRFGAIVTRIIESTKLAFINMVTAIETQFVTLNTTVATLLGPDAGLLKIINDSLLGEGNLIPKTIGVKFMQGVSQGIISQKENLANALLTAFRYGFDAVSEEWEISSPSRKAARDFGMPLSQGVAAGILQGSTAISRAANAVMSNAFMSSLQSSFGSRPSMMGVGGTSNVSHTTNYNLNVTSSANSQGIISDFAILRAMA